MPGTQTFGPLQFSPPHCPHLTCACAVGVAEDAGVVAVVIVGFGVELGAGEETGGGVVPSLAAILA